MAAIGFGWCSLIGVPLIAFAKRRGWTTKMSDSTEEIRPQLKAQTPPPGGMETLSLQLVWIGAIYLAVFGILLLAAQALASRPQIAVMIWGFHFIIAGMVTMLVRRLINVTKIPPASPCFESLILT